MKTLTTLFCTFFMTISLNSTAQIVVNPTSFSTTFIPAFGTIVNYAYDGTGLLAFPTLSQGHTPTIPTNSFVASGSTGSIDFFFNGTYSINGISFWNQNAGGPSTDIGVDSLNFFASTDNINYTLIPGAPTNYIEVLTDTSAPETDSFPDVLATSIRIQIFSNHSPTASNVGFAEIAFSASRLVGIDELSKLHSIKIFPNPSSEFITLEGIYKKQNFNIYNISGKEIIRGRVSKGEKIDIRSLENGLYFLKVEESSMFKLIKQ